MTLMDALTGRTSHWNNTSGELYEEIMGRFGELPSDIAGYYVEGFIHITYLMFEAMFVKPKGGGIDMP